MLSTCTSPPRCIAGWQHLPALDQGLLQRLAPDLDASPEEALCDVCAVSCGHREEGGPEPHSEVAQILACRSEADCSS